MDTTPIVTITEDATGDPTSRDARGRIVDGIEDGDGRLRAVIVRLDGEPVADPFLAAALGLAHLGCPVFPVTAETSLADRPTGTTDPRALAAGWQLNVGARVGIALGCAPGWVGLGIASDNGGQDSLGLVDAVLGDTPLELGPPYLVARAPGDEVTVLYRHPEGGPPIASAAVARGLRILGDGTAIVAWSTRHRVRGLAAILADPAWPAEAATRAPWWLGQIGRLPKFAQRSDLVTCDDCGRLQAAPNRRLAAFAALRLFGGVVGMQAIGPEVDRWHPCTRCDKAGARIDIARAATGHP